MPLPPTLIRTIRQTTIAHFRVLLAFIIHMQSLNAQMQPIVRRANINLDLVTRICARGHLITAEGNIEQIAIARQENELLWPTLDQRGQEVLAELMLDVTEGEGEMLRLVSELKRLLEPYSD